MKDKMTKQSRHFGFITFKTEAAAKAACAETHTIDGRTVRGGGGGPMGGARPQPYGRSVCQEEGRWWHRIALGARVARGASVRKGGR